MVTRLECFLCYCKCSCTKELATFAHIKQTLAWHKSSVGLGIGQDVKTEVNYIPEKVSNLVTSSLSMGAVAIDGDALRVQLCAE